MSEVDETVVEAVTDIPEIVEDVYAARPTGLIAGCTIGGMIIGGALGYFLTRRLLEKKYIDAAEEEIDQMREHFRSREAVLEDKATKLLPLKEIVAAKGYSTAEEKAMVVEPPKSVVDAAKAAEEPEDADERVETVDEHLKRKAQERNIFKTHGDNIATPEWDFREEVKRRSTARPYVIHFEEREESEYEEITYTYYEADDVVCNERDEVMDAEDRDRVLGEANLERFGHGSNDPSIVYIRNDTLELQAEVVLSPNSYAEEVHGFRHSDYSVRRSRGHGRFDDDE